jgi:UDP-N-acetylglucosamine/UDP-N-acetylgalactosamine diphosphorylase
MAGGTDRKNHSEVGSSYIHFNYTPNQDKATASLIGDVPRGVMLNQRPIFLGGQGGLVGPCRLTYGNIIAAGTVHRKDELRPNRLLFGGPIKPGNIAFTPGMYSNEKRIIFNNLVYIANLGALQHWYKHVRALFVSDQFPQALLEGLQVTLQAGIDERIKRLKQFGEKMQASAKPESSGRGRAGETKTQLNDRWAELEEVLNDMSDRTGDRKAFDRFMEKIQSDIGDKGKYYLKVIKGLNPGTAELGTSWLQSIVNAVVEAALEVMPEYKIK